MGQPRGRPDREAVADVFEELRQSGLSLGRLPGNSAKVRLALDLAAQIRAEGPLRVLDVGCAGPAPLNLWEPFLPLADALELTGVDVAGLDRVERRARELGLRIELREGSALALSGSFDAVVSTQVLEHLRDWRAALREMAAVVRPGGRLYVTCDSGDLRRPVGDRMRLALKRVYARLPARLQAGPLSGEWERAPRTTELREASEGVGLEVERLAPYSIQAVKTAQRHAGAHTRQLWLAFEKALAGEAGDRLDVGLFSILYLRARRP